jgi:predicted secreted protein
VRTAVRHTEFESHVVLAVGGERRLPLPSLAMAGYRWSVSVSGEDTGAVTLQLRRGELRPGSKPGLSAPEEAVVRGIRPGRALVRLEQRRPWESEQPPAQLLEVKVEVRPQAPASQGAARVSRCR